MHESNKSFPIFFKLNACLINLNANIFAATHLKPSSLMRKVNMLDILTGGLMRL